VDLERRLGSDALWREKSRVGGLDAPEEIRLEGDEARGERWPGRARPLRPLEPARAEVLAGEALQGDDALVVTAPRDEPQLRGPQELHEDGDEATVARALDTRERPPGSGLVAPRERAERRRNLSIVEARLDRRRTLLTLTAALAPELGRDEKQDRREEAGCERAQRPFVRRPTSM
jgi:hypothetical protein